MVVSLFSGWDTIEFRNRLLKVISFESLVKFKKKICKKRVRWCLTNVATVFTPRRLQQQFKQKKNHKNVRQKNRQNPARKHHKKKRAEYPLKRSQRAPIAQLDATSAHSAQDTPFNTIIDGLEKLPFRPRTGCKNAYIHPMAPGVRCAKETPPNK